MAEFLIEMVGGILGGILEAFGMAICTDKDGDLNPVGWAVVVASLLFFIVLAVVLFRISRG